MSVKFTGGCLCGAVRYESTANPIVSAHCHCEDCRRSSGTGHCTHLVLPKPALTVSGQLKGYKKATDSGNMVERSFCPTCGAAVFSTNSGLPDLIFPRASSLDDLEVAKPAMVVYSSRAASWDQQDPALPSFAEMPPPDSNPL